MEAPSGRAAIRAGVAVRAGTRPSTFEKRSRSPGCGALGGPGRKAETVDRRLGIPRRGEALCGGAPPSFSRGQSRRAAPEEQGIKRAALPTDPWRLRPDPPRRPRGHPSLDAQALALGRHGMPPPARHPDLRPWCRSAKLAASRRWSREHGRCRPPVRLIPEDTWRSRRSRPSAPPPRANRAPRSTNRARWERPAPRGRAIRSSRRARSTCSARLRQQHPRADGGVGGLVDEDERTGRAVAAIFVVADRRHRAQRDAPKVV